MTQDSATQATARGMVLGCFYIVLIAVAVLALMGACLGSLAT